MMISSKRVIIFTIFSVLPLHCFTYNNESENEMILSREKRKVLFFPQYTTLQISMCLIAQVSAITSHRLALNHGFQMNYQLPFNVSSYYSPIFWARKFSKSSNLLIDFFEKLASSDDFDEAKSDENLETTTILSEKSEKESKERRKRMIEPDLTAGQFYSFVTETME